MTQIELQNLKKSIWRAFEGVSVPRKLLNTTIEDLEVEDIRHFYSETPREDITIDSVRAVPRGGDGLIAFLTNEAFVYYLPAYLMICLDHCLDAPGVLSDSVMWRLAFEIEKDGAPEDYPYTSEQKSAISDFFKYMLHRYGEDNFDFDLMQASAKYD